jgi:phage terminase large subunit-like protein
VEFDPYGVSAIVDDLDEVGISGHDRIVGISQGWKLTGAVKTAERKLADKTLRHSGQGLMAWAVGNARVEPKGNAIIITKQASGSAKIDPLMAAFNAIALMATHPWSAQPGITWI